MQKRNRQLLTDESYCGTLTLRQKLRLGLLKQITLSYQGPVKLMIRVNFDVSAQTLLDGKFVPLLIWSYLLTFLDDESFVEKF